MGFLSLFSKSKPAVVVEEAPPPPPPTGTFTIDHAGNISGCTVPSHFPQEAIQEVGRAVMDLMRAGKAAGAPVSDVVLQFESLKITARERRGGGAVVFFSPSRLGGR